MGVFTGLFSATLLAVTQPRKMYFVDPWWREFGDRYPDWGMYTDGGRLATRVAYEASSRRIRRHAGRAETVVEVGYSTEFLPSKPDGHFDWVYLDASHAYEKVRAELALVRPKMRPGGVVAGDDYYTDADHIHAGLARAVQEAAAGGAYELVGTFAAAQWALRVPLA